MTRDDVMNARTPNGGWTKAQLAEWGVPWPPPKGWLAKLTGLLEANPGKSQYEVYLLSDDWKAKRAQKLSSKRRCAICGSEERIEIHHLNYRNLTDAKQSDLRRLCHRCHMLAHQLHRAGKFQFSSTNHHHRFTLLKTAVEKALKG